MRKIIGALGVILLMTAAAAGGYFIGVNTAPPVTGDTFYATIEEINGSRLLVKGLEVNDINSRGRFDFNVTPATELEWRHTAIRLDDLQVGDRVSVTYVGDIQETEPAGITDVRKVKLLEDEK